MDCICYINLNVIVVLEEHIVEVKALEKLYQDKGIIRKMILKLQVNITISANF